MQNITSTPIDNSIYEKLSARTNTSLVEDIITSKQFVGNSTQVISASYGQFNGSLVYKVKTLDGNGTISRLNIDPGNRNIIYREKFDGKFYNRNIDRSLGNSTQSWHGDKNECMNKIKNRHTTFHNFFSNNDRLLNENL